MDSSSKSTPSIPAHAPTALFALQAKRPGVWSGLGTVALYFLLQLGLGALFGLLIGVALGIARGIQAAHAHRKPDTDAILHALRSDTDIRVILAALTLAAAAATMALIVRRTWPALWSCAKPPGFGFTRPDSRRAWPLAVVLGVSLSLLGSGMTDLFAGSHPLQQDIVELAINAPLGLRILLALVGVCIAPFVEELIFRGVLLSGLASRMRVGSAVAVSALIFGCAHLPDFGFAWYPIPALVLLGLVLGWMRVQTRSLWPSIALHATYNSVAVLAWFVIAHP